MTATETHGQYVARLQRAQGELLDKLKADVADRSVHVRYLRMLLDAPADQLDDVPRPHGVGLRVSAALIEDLTWLRAPAPEPGQMISGFPGAYRRCRAVLDAVTAKARASQKARREGTAPALRSLLRLESS
jgi:hypothetical protein